VTITPARRAVPRADRPAPDWALVYRRNSIERLKRDSPPLRVREELPELIARGYEDIPEEDIVRLHWWGLAHDKPKTGTFMVRIKVPGGQVTSSQLRALGGIAREYGRDEAELTTRQGIQLHWVRLGQLPEVLAALEGAGLTTFAGEGDTVRNITSCPAAGLTAEEPFDVRPVIRAVADFFNGNAEFTNLPRKHKYTISACAAQCNAPEISDVALVGTVKDGRPGFALRVGGGMANTPRISRDLGVFVPVDEAVEVLVAVTNAWQKDLRYRVSRAKARIKFMVDDLGADGMRTRVEDQLGRRLEDGVAPEPTGDADHMGAHAQPGDGLSYVGVPVPSGRVTGSLLEGLADLAEDLGAEVRFTRQQNVLIGNVPTDRPGELEQRLDVLGLKVGRSRAYARSVACTSHRFCNYSVAETKGKLDEILDNLTDRFGAEPIGDLGIHMDGCPHACAQHWIGELGLQGTTTRVDGAEGRVEAYDVTVGGGLGRRTAVGRRLLRRVPTHEVDGVVERLVGGWLEAKAAGDDPSLTLGDFTNASTDEQLLALVGGSTEDAPVRGVVIHIPGLLLSQVGGQDRFEVQATTVGEALAAIAHDHPEFGRTVVPDGKVASSYLIALGEEDIRELQDLATPVTPGNEITVVMAMAGG
jgi:ferredoxin-nitrite reductase